MKKSMELYIISKFLKMIKLMQYFTFLKIQTEFRNNVEILKQIPAKFDDNFDKLGGEFETKEKIDDFDLQYFAEKEEVKSKKPTKDLARLIKFCFKRGEVCFSK